MAAAAVVSEALYLWMCLALISSSGVESEPLYFSLMVSSAAGQNTSGVVPSVERALQDINNDPNIIAAGYSLNYTRVLDTECNSTKSLQLFHEDLQSDKPLLAVVGCGCSFATELVSKVTYLNHVVTISYASTSVVLNDRSMYHSFFRTIPSDELIPAALVTVMDHYNWTRLAVVSERKQQYIENFNMMKRILSESNITVFDSDIQELSLLLSEENSVREQHIFYLNMSPRNALDCLCKAARSRCYYPDHLWMVPGWYSEDWWKDFSNYLTTINNCTLREIEQALNRSLTLIPVPAGEFIGNLPSSSSYAADAVKALGIAINASTNTCGSDERRQCMFTAVTKALRDVEFDGLSGVVSFNNAGGRRESQVILQQYRQQHNETKKQLVATLSEDTVLYVNGENDSTMWPDGIPPDGTPVELIVGIDLLVSVFVYVLIGIAAIFGAICLIFNILFRNRKVVRLTSPKLNYAIIFGSMLQVAFLFTYNVNINNLTLLASICTVRRACINLGHNISFSLAMLKAWRVHYIFRNPKPGKRAPQDWKLLLMACGLVMVDVILLPLFIPDFLFNESAFRTDEGISITNENGVELTLSIPNCGTTPYYLAWLVLAIGYKLTLHAVALVLAFRTQAVEVDALNDSKYTVAIIYISSILMIALLFVIVFTSSQINLYTAAIAVLITLDVYAFLGLTFIPKMIVLYKDPRGKNIFARTCTGTAEASHSTIPQATNPLYGQRKGSLSLKENSGNGKNIGPARLKEQEVNSLRI